MSKKGRNTSRQDRAKPRGVGQAIPDAVTRGAMIIEAEIAKKGEMIMSLAANSYRNVDSFQNHGRAVEIGLIGAARPALSQERFIQFFQFASLLGASQQFSMHRFERKSNAFKPVKVQVYQHDVDAFLVHIPVGAARHTYGGKTVEPHGFTTGVPILSPQEPSVSFVASSPTMKPADRTMAAATEIMQNRLIVDSFSLESGKTYDQSKQVVAYQESLANGVGNMLGAVALGWPYKRYEEYLSTVFDRTPIHSSVLKSPFNLATTELLAPHIMFDSSVYGQLLEGDLPASAPEIIPRRPLGT